jgi:hypothetical protein
MSARSVEGGAVFSLANRTFIDAPGAIVYSAAGDAVLYADAGLRIIRWGCCRAARAAPLNACRRRRFDIKSRTAEPWVDFLAAPALSFDSLAVLDDTVVASFNNSLWTATAGQAAPSLLYQCARNCTNVNIDTSGAAPRVLFAQASATAGARCLASFALRLTMRGCAGLADIIAVPVSAAGDRVTGTATAVVTGVAAVRTIFASPRTAPLTR